MRWTKKKTKRRQSFQIKLRYKQLNSKCKFPPRRPSKKLRNLRLFASFGLTFSKMCSLIAFTGYKNVAAWSTCGRMRRTNRPKRPLKFRCRCKKWSSKNSTDAVCHRSSRSTLASVKRLREWINSADFISKSHPQGDATGTRLRDTVLEVCRGRDLGPIVVAKEKYAIIREVPRKNDSGTRYEFYFMM